MTNAQMSRRLFTLLAVCAKKQDMLKEIALDKFRLSPAYETIQNIDDYLFLTDRMILHQNNLARSLFLSAK